jgi:hypothetical protein
MFIVEFNVVEYRKMLVAEALVIGQKGAFPNPEPSEFNYYRGKLDGILKALEMLDELSIMPS